MVSVLSGKKKWGKAEVLNLWVTILLGVNDPFTGVTYQVPCILDVYIVVHNRGKIKVMK